MENSNNNNNSITVDIAPTGTPGPNRGTIRRRRLGALVAMAAATAAVPATSVSADATYRTYHAPLTAIGDEPLQAGFVNNIHAEGPTVYAMEYYHLVRARPSTTYTAVIYLHLGDPACTGPALDLGFLGGIPSATFTTNAAGNGHGASPKFTPEDVAPLRGVEHGVNWVIVDESLSPVFESGCSPDFLD
jgi:hypothetical protein